MITDKDKEIPKDLSAAAAGQQTTEPNKVYQAKKFYVGVGNNYGVVKSVLKQRYWWQYSSEEAFSSECDFIWTSWKKQKHIDYLSNINKKRKKYS